MSTTPTTICACAASQFAVNYNSPQGVSGNDGLRSRPVSGLGRALALTTLSLLTANATRVAAGINLEPAIPMSMPGGMTMPMDGVPTGPSGPLAPCCQGERLDAVLESTLARLKEEAGRPGTDRVPQPEA